jgi:hypothetical protein
LDNDFEKLVEQSKKKEDTVQEERTTENAFKANEKN